MNKTWIIIKREFFARTKKKTFLLTTILLPLLLFGFYAAIIYFGVKGESEKKIAIIDQYNLLNERLEPISGLTPVFLNTADPESFKADFEKEGFHGFLTIPANLNLDNPETISLFVKTPVGIATQERLESRINKAIERRKLELLLAVDVRPDRLDSLKSSLSLRTISVTEDGTEKEKNAAMASGAGFAMGILIYMVLMIYGTMVMRGVMEEKTSRIAEVMVSSVKPFQLMMGKIIGIGAVGLVQFLIWGVLLISLQFLIPVLMPGAFDQLTEQATAGLAAGQQINMNTGAMGDFASALQTINLTQIIFGFIVYFMGGYFLYSSLFAAVGSAVNEDPQDAQQLLLPIMMPIIFSFVIMARAVQDPHSGMAVFGSIFPLTSPIVMMARLPFGVPTWELVLSMALLLGGFIGTTWLAAKIYRTGILLYGKKVTWKEMWKWVSRNG